MKNVSYSLDPESKLMEEITDLFRTGWFQVHMLNISLRKLYENEKHDDSINIRQTHFHVQSN